MILFSEAGERDLRKLPAPARKKIGKALRRIESRPKQGAGVRKLRGTHDLYRLRVGDTRVVTIVRGADVVISVIAHRRDVYRKARRRK